MSLRVENCCFCLPLRNGLLLWGYFCLVTIYLSALSTLYRLQDFFYDASSFRGNEFFFLFISLVLLLLYFIFHIVLVAGLHKKSKCMLEVYDGSLIISMVLESIVAGLYIPLAMLRSLEYDIQHDDNSSIFLFGIAVLVVLEILFKYYILVCVRSLISTLAVNEEDFHSEYSLENPDVIVYDNIKKRKKDINLQIAGNFNVHDVTVHDGVNTSSRNNSSQTAGNSAAGNNTITEKEENPQTLQNSDVTVHDNTNKEKEENPQSIQNSDVTVHDGINTSIKNDNSQAAGNSDVIVNDKEQNRNNDEDKEMVTANQYHIIASPGTS
ncbi:uncharacterized protein LOC123873342 isoform X2 [Maniola jurtina]|uniref:uncharacterized protein LOC123873342 isoform X2 n=1 Tax=Maniola jurtina TaxID=191418 RepID=UPI001E686284|nr:uncharacterized protein LOC123873342 isoform X2 [Maniola jurtina]